MINLLRSVFQPYAIFLLVSLFLAFSNVFVPKYFLDENDFKNYRLFFNMANIFGPLLLLGVDLSVGFIELKKLIGFIKLYLIFVIVAITILVIGESIDSEFNTRILYGVLFVGSIQLVASLLLKIGKINGFYFLSQIYTKLIPISAMFLSICFFGIFSIEFSLLVACFLLAIPAIVSIPYLRSNKNIAPSIGVLDLKVVSLVFGTLAVDMVIRLPYLLSLDSEPGITNLIDIVTAFTSTLIYPVMLYSRKIELDSKMNPVDFYKKIRPGYFSIGGIQLLLVIIGVCSLWYVGRIGIVSYEPSQLIRIGFGLAFCSTMISVIPNFIKIYIFRGLDSYKHNLLWLSMCLTLSGFFWMGYIDDVILVTTIFVTLSFIGQYSIAVKWTGSYVVFLNYNSLALSLIFLLMFIYSYQYAY